MCWQNADQRERNRRHDDERRNKRTEPAHNQHVNQDQDSREGESQIAEHFYRDVPLAIPLHGEAVGALGHGCALVLLYAVAIGQFDFVDGVAHLHDGVDRALFSARHISRHVDDWLQILAVDAGIDRRLLKVGYFLQGDLPAGWRRQLQVAEVFDARAIRARQPHFDWNVLARMGIVKQAGVGPTEPHLQSARTSAGEIPWSAALSRSTFMSYLVCGSSTYQSTSTTPGVCWKTFLI